MLAPRAGERLFRTAPFVERDDDGWRMLYIGGDVFAEGPQGKALPRYSLMELTSPSPWVWDGPSTELLAPDTFPAEIGNAILVAGWRGRVPAGQGPLLLRDVLNTAPALHASLPDLLPREVILELISQAEQLTSAQPVAA